MMMVLVPLTAFGFEWALESTGLSYVTFGTLSKFLANPVTILLIAIIFIVLSVLVLVEDIFLKEFFYLKRINVQIKALDLVFHVMKQVTKSIKASIIFKTWSRMLFFNFPLIFFTVREARIFSFLKSETSTSFVWIVVVVTLTVLVYSSHRDHVEVLCGFLHWNILQATVFMGIYVLLMLITVFIISLSVDRTLAVAALISVSNRIHGVFAIGLFLLSTWLHYALYMIIGEHLLDMSEYDVTISQYVSYKQVFSKTSRQFISSGLVLFILFDLFFYVELLKNGSALDVNAIDQIQITSHRGYSHDYPENTLPAILRAIEVYSDYVEVDVRITKDGIFILLHDSTLKRTTGVNQAIKDVTYDEIRQLDAGKWLNSDFEGVTIPTLGEVFEASKGQILLNLDLKLNHGDLEAIPELIALISDYEMENQCMVTSTCLECLDAIKKMNPDIKTGFITYRLTPKLLEDPAIDAFSMKASLVTKTVVERAHIKGKKIMVWTVNNSKEIERLSRLGVDNLITDRPSYTREILAQASGDRYFLSLLKVIMD